MSKDYHLSLSLSRELWNELLSAALPVKLAGEGFDLTRDARQAVRRIGVRQRVAGLLEDRQPPRALVQVKDRAVASWRKRRPVVYQAIRDLVRVEGEWRVELDDLGTELTYGTQRVNANAYVRGVAEGTIHLLKENVVIPFSVERRVGASVALGDIRYDPGHRAVLGSVQDLGVYIGDHAVLQLLSRLTEYLLDQQLPRVNPVPILRRDQVQELVGPMGGALRLNMGVEALDLEVSEGDLVLKVRFGFTRAQLTEQSGR